MKQHRIRAWCDANIGVIKACIIAAALICSILFTILQCAIISAIASSVLAGAGYIPLISAKRRRKIEQFESGMARLEKMKQCIHIQGKGARGDEALNMLYDGVLRLCHSDTEPRGYIAECPELDAFNDWAVAFLRFAGELCLDIFPETYSKADARHYARKLHATLTPSEEALLMLYSFGIARADRRLAESYYLLLVVGKIRGIALAPVLATEKGKRIFARCFVSPQSLAAAGRGARL